MSRAFALSRTTRLINRVFFDGEAEEEAVARGLAATTVRLLADAESMSDACGQAALIGAFQLIARMGIGIELAVADVPLINAVPPLRRRTLRSALLELGEPLIPETTLRTERGAVAVTFVFGTTPCAEQGAIHVYAGDFQCHLSWDRPDAFPSATGPLGGLAAAGAAAAIALEHAVPEIERTTGIPPPPPPPPRAAPDLRRDLRSTSICASCSRAWTVARWRRGRRTRRSARSTRSVAERSSTALSRRCCSCRTSTATCA